MYYIPMLKTRKHELSLASNLNFCFSETIIPLFEIINDIFEPRYKIDPITGKYVYEERGKQKRKVIEPFTDEDIITLRKIDEIVNHKAAFIDFFRYSIEKYGRRVDISKAALSFKLNNDQSLYKRRIEEISIYKNLIPVVSIKESYSMDKVELKTFLIALMKNNNCIALRLTEYFLQEYKELLEQVLRPCDFLLFDIQEQNPKYKFMEFEELIAMNITARKILINSPRKTGINNKEYPENNYTDLIDNCAREQVIEYNFSGYGDYCGLKDDLPTSSGSNGKGAALALIYDYSCNKFWAYTNRDTSLGIHGYRSLLPIIENEKTRFDSNNICEGYKKIHLTQCGNWGTWNNICATRYIHQIYTNVS